MKKNKLITIAFTCAAISVSAGQMTQTVSDGSVVQSRTLDGDKLTTSVCKTVQTPQGALSQCLSETRKLSKKDAMAARDQFLMAQGAVMYNRDPVSEAFSQGFSYDGSSKSSSSSSYSMDKAMQAQHSRNVQTTRDFSIQLKGIVR